MIVVGPDRLVAGQAWKNVQAPDSTVGWISGQFLVSVATGAVTPSPTGAVVAQGTRTPVVAAATIVRAATATAAPSAVSFLDVVGGRPGQSGTVVVQAAPGAHCTIDLVTSHGLVSAAPGLVAKDADASGHVSWTWPIGAGLDLGVGAVTVACDGASATTEIVIG